MTKIIGHEDINHIFFITIYHLKNYEGRVERNNRDQIQKVNLSAGANPFN